MYIAYFTSKPVLTTHRIRTREAATVQPIATHLMQKQLRWYGHVRRSDESHTTKTVMYMVAQGVRPRGRPTLRYMDTIRRDIKKWADGRQHSRSQGLEIGSFKGDPLTWKSLQGENTRTLYSRINTGHHQDSIFLFTLTTCRGV